MKKLFIILFLLTVSFRVAAQNEQTKDSTLLNRFPTEMGKEPLSPPPGTTAAPNRDMSVKTSLSTDSTDLHITLPTYYPNFPWMDIRMGKMVSSYDPFVMDYEHYGAFQLSPNSILSTFSTYNTYPTMGTIIQSGADFIYRPNERWELTGACIPPSTPSLRACMVLNSTLAWMLLPPIASTISFVSAFSGNIQALANKTL